MTNPTRIEAEYTIAEGDDWAEEATSAWLAAAREAGLDPEVASIEVRNPDCEVAHVAVDGERYVLRTWGGRPNIVGAVGYDPEAHEYLGFH